MLCTMYLKLRRSFPYIMKNVDLGDLFPKSEGNERGICMKAFTEGERRSSSRFITRRNGKMWWNA